MLDEPIRGPRLDQLQCHAIPPAFHGAQVTAVHPEEAHVRMLERHFEILVDARRLKNRWP